MTVIDYLIQDSQENYHIRNSFQGRDGINASLCQEAFTMCKKEGSEGKN